MTAATPGEANARATPNLADAARIPIPGQGPGGEQTATQATEAVLVVAVEMDDHRRRGLTPATFLLTLFAAYFLYKIQVVVVLLIVGILLATAVSGPSLFLSRRLRLPRPLAILIVYIGIIAALVGLIYLLLPPIIGEGTRFVREVPALLDNWRAQLQTNGNALVRNAADRAFAILDTQSQGGGISLPTDLAVGFLSGIGGALVTLFTLFLIAFY